MTTELYGHFFKPELVIAEVTKVTKAYSSSVITSNIIGCYDDRDTRSFSSLKLYLVLN